MKETHGWWWPDHEKHMIDWMNGPKNRIKLNDRWTYQGRKQEAVLALCKQLGKSRTAIDVGGHVGLWAFNLMHAFAHVQVFEPVHAHQECFDKNVFEHPSYRGGSVTMNPFALGAKEGMVSMNSEKGSSGNTTVAGAGDIPMHTLDSFNFEAVDLIKIDCEGYEENVLIGGAVTIANHKPVIIVEQKRDMSQRFGFKPQGAVTYLQAMGYKVVKEISGDFICAPA